MQSRETTVTQKGQITIPREIRISLGLKPRDRVVVELEGDSARLRPVRSKLLEGYGAVSPHQRPEDFQQRRREFEQAVAEEGDAER